MTPATLKQWRTGLGLTQIQAAELLGVDQSQITRWERGERKIPRWLRGYLDCLETVRVTEKPK